MRTTSDIPSVTHPDYVHPPGTEVTLSLYSGGHYRMMELSVPPGVTGEEGWTERFLLPRGMKVDPGKPILLGVVPTAAAQPAPATLPVAKFVLNAEGHVVGVGVTMDDGRFQLFALGGEFVDERGAPIRSVDESSAPVR